MRDVRCCRGKFCRLVGVARLPAGETAVTCRQTRASDISMLIGNGLILRGESGSLWAGTPRPDVEIM